MTSQRHYLESELEQLIRDDPAIWRFIREGSLDGVWYWDLQNTDHEYMSPEFWENFGFDPAERAHLAAEWQDLIFPEDLEIAKENFKKHIADPSYPYDQVVRYRRADGGVSWVRCRGIAIRDADGTAIRLLGAHNDITALKLEEQATKATKNELETIFDTATSGIVALDETGQILRINNHARHMLGGLSTPTPFPWPKSIGFLEAETLHPLDASADPVRRALSGHRLRSETHLMRRVQPGADRRYVRMDSARVHSNDSNIHVVLVIDDVSNEERNRQVVERKSRLDALGQLTGGIAHDFNNLLAALLYSVDLAGRAKDPAKREEYLDRAQRSIDRGRTLTARLLSFARKQPGLATTQSTRKIFADFQKLVRPMLEANIEFTFDLEDYDFIVFCDHAQLETALMNVVLNSRDAILRSGKGSFIKLQARAVRAPQDRFAERDAEMAAASDGSKSLRYIEISVVDNGPGMEAETLARAADPFFTTKDTNSGTGLGLAMVYGFVSQSEGDFRIYSEEGIGTTVKMTLPRGTSQGTREEPVAENTFDQGQGQTILLVEDELELLTVMTELLEDIGYNVVSAMSGHAALEIVSKGTDFDVLLTDVVMPGRVGGFELAKLVRAKRADIPVIYLSGYTGFTATEMGSVVAPLLQKPAPPAELAKVIQAALNPR